MAIIRERTIDTIHLEEASTKTQVLRDQLRVTLRVKLPNFGHTIEQVFVTVPTLSHDVYLGMSFIRRKDIQINIQANSSAELVIPYHPNDQSNLTATNDGDETERTGTQAQSRPSTSETNTTSPLLDLLIARTPSLYHALLREYAIVFASPPPRTERASSITPHMIKLLDDATPTRTRARSLDPTRRTAMKTLLDNFMAKGWIRRTTPDDATAWCSPAFLVPKPDGSWRLVIDYRALNAKTKKDGYRMPTIDELLHFVNGIQGPDGSRVFSKLDFTSGFYQIDLDAGSVPISAFGTEFGTFVWLVMPMGLSNSPATFQRTMDMLFSDLLNQCLAIYIDDMILTTPEHGSHLARLRTIFERLEKHGLRLNPEKCSIGAEAIEFVGFHLTQTGIAPLDHKLDTLAKWPRPTTKQQVITFLGAIGYYRRFIRDFSQIAHRLHALTLPSAQFNWDESAQLAFDELRNTLARSITLFSFHPERQTRLFTDASQYAIGAVLEQLQPDTTWAPIVLYSHRLTEVQQRWSAIDRETFALVHFIQQHQHLMPASTLQVYSDHNPLAYLTSKTELRPKEYGWLDTIQSHDICIKHIAGKTNVVADGLSRMDLPPTMPTTASPTTTSAATQVLVAYRTDTMLFAADPDRVELIRQAYRTHPEFANLLTTTTNDNHSEVQTKIDAFTFVVSTDGLIYMFDTKTQERTLVVLDKNVQTDIINNIHRLAHQGTTRTLNKLREVAWWPGMSQQVAQFVLSCQACQHQKQGRPQKPPAVLTDVPQKKFARLHMDFLLGLPLVDGYDSILVVEDALTRFIHLIAARKDWTAADCLHALDTTLFKFVGYPAEIVFDADPLFTAQVFEAYANALQLSLRPAAKHHHQSNGIAERAIRTVRDALRAVSVNDINSWPRRLTAIQLGINSSTASALGGLHSPGEALFGQPLLTPADLTIPRTFRRTTIARDNEMITLIRDKLLLNNTRNKQQQDANDIARKLTTAAQRFKPGDQVLVSTILLPSSTANAVPAKLLPRWIGPLRVTAIDEYGNVSVQWPPGWKNRPKVFREFVKPYVAPDRPDARFRAPFFGLVTEAPTDTTYVLLKIVYDSYFAGRRLFWCTYTNGFAGWESETSVRQLDHDKWVTYMKQHHPNEPLFPAIRYLDMDNEEDNETEDPNYVDSSSTTIQQRRQQNNNQQRRSVDRS